MGLFYYFLVAQNKDHIHAMIDQPKIQLAKRTACMSGLPLPFWRAIHAGAKIMPIRIIAQATYFTAIKISMFCIILHII